MPAKNTPDTDTASLVTRLSQDYPQVSFVAGRTFSWHAGTGNISYRQTGRSDVRSTWAILHELGHALLEHTDFESDVELLHMEVAAWDKARLLAERYKVRIDEEYVQDCLDSYRDWLHLRATCPTCFIRCLQADSRTYRCHNCNTTWHVTRSRLCRPYRRKH